jgi:ribosomal-protein-alanine N-acetyltransferase
MRQVLEMMKASMVDDVFLEVRKSNVAAKELYRKLNFKESYERKKYYGDEDAVIMRLIFNEYI